MVDPSLYSSSVVKVKLGTPTRQLTQGRHWDDGGGYTGIRSITVVHSYLGVSTIQVEYDLFGKPVLGEEHRVAPWASRIEINTREKEFLDFPSEFLIGMSYDREWRSFGNLHFMTNKRRIGPFGSSETSRRFSSGNPQFQCSVDGGTGAIVGFFGLSPADDEYIHFIGLYIAVLCPTADFFDKMQEQGLMPYRTSPLSTPSPSSTMLSSASSEYV